MNILDGEHNITQIIDKKKNPWLKPILISTGTIIIIIGGIVLACFLFTKNFENKIYPNISIGGIDLGGLTQLEAVEILSAHYDGMLDDGLTISSPQNNNELQNIEIIDLRLSGATDPDLIRDVISFNPDGKALEAYEVARKDHWFINITHAILQLFYKKEIDPEVFVDTEILKAEIANLFEKYENSGSFTDYIVNFNNKETKIEIVEGSIGMILDLESAMNEINTDAQDFYLEILNLKLIETENPISTEEASMLTNKAREIIDEAPYSLTYTSEMMKEYSWEISKEEIADWILPWQDNDEINIILEEEKIEKLFNKISNEINVPPTNARFVINNGVVSEFAGSLSGIELNKDKTLDLIMQTIGLNEHEVITIAVSTIEPEINTGSINDFGIEEILGVGVSDFSGSPYNRIQNIKHGASKLNGLLIAPNETISLVETLRPFTISDGYLPELVIKGDEIKAEIGGGLCQIGTTTFRAVMNAGLEVTERRNHSLVVSYYNDPSNGNPGTDATIYDPSPDFKFTNTYDSYILLTTEVDEANRQLYFTFWGSNDGRNGYYSPPVVLTWTGYGATQYTDTDSLDPGVTRCQYPHPGATTTFDYFIEWNDGSISEQNFTSTYRSLPKICLIGIDPSSEDTETDELEVTDVDF